MAGFVTSKQLLNVYDVNTVTDDEGNETRGTAYEFQDYAYRLAAKLNDLEHLAIYMRLVKKYPRFLLESAFESIADSNEFNKGRLFMWKFKKVREEIKLKKDLMNFSHKHVVKKMSMLKDELSKMIIKKNDQVENNPIAMFIAANTAITNSSKKVLFVGLDSTILTAMFANDFNIYGNDISKKFVTIHKETYKNEARKFICKDFLDKNYKLHEFDLIIIQNYFNLIPHESELQLIKHIQRSLKPSGKLILNFHHSDEDSQIWKEMSFKGEKRFYFQKKNNTEKLINVFSENGFSQIDIGQFGDQTVIALEHVID